MKRCAVYQAGYWQPLHYYARMLDTDIFVVLTQAQLNRKVGQTSATMYGKGGKFTLKVPIKGGNRVTIDEAVPDYESGWVDEHLKSLKMAYSKAKMFGYWYPLIEGHLKTCQSGKYTLADMGMYQVLIVASYLEYQGAVVKSAPKMAEDMNGSDWMLQLSKEAKATTYVCGRVAYDEYLELDTFKQEGIDVEVQNWMCPRYVQMGKVFEPNLSIVDLLMNCTREEVINVLKGCQNE